MNTCDHIRAQLLELSDPKTIPSELRQHVHNCGACQRFHDELIALQQQLTAWPEADVSDEVFAQTLAAVQQEQPAKTPQRLNPQWATGLAASFVLVAVAGLLYNNQLGEFQPDFSQAPVDGVKAQRDLERPQELPLVDEWADAEAGYEVIDALEERQQAQDFTVTDLAAQYRQEPGLDADEAEWSGQLEAIDTPQTVGRVTVTGARNKRKDLAEGNSALADKAPGLEADEAKTMRRKNVLPQTTDDAPPLAESLSLEGLVSKTLPDVSEQEVAPVTEPPAKPEPRPAREPEDTLSEVLQSPPASELERLVKQSDDFGHPSVVSEKEDSLRDGRKAEAFKKRNRETSNDWTDQPTHTSVQVAEHWLSEQHKTTGLSFKSTSGYWANTYLPGDPQMRWIEARLLGSGQANVPLTQAVQQPFDPPTNAALAMFVHTDQAGMNATGPARMRLQVGIRAGEHQGGHRSALNLAVVLDLTARDREAEVRALLMALLKHKQPGDQISVYHTAQTGSSHSRVLGPDEFRHGPIQLLLQQWYGPATETPDRVGSLDQVLNEAWGWLAEGDDPQAVLGSSAVWLISDKNNPPITTLKQQIQHQATQGISFNTLSLHPDNPHNQLKQVALLGQGHHHVMAGGHDAGRVVKAQLQAASQAVARALRLHIKLAQGVQLIDVIGSQPLNERQTTEVKQAEQSLDQRMAANLGITADRGEDDDGIQIIIPGFYASDEHVVLLDLLVNQPGVVADVSLRYKDLIHLRNAKVTQQLVIAAGPQSRGPLERNVLKNLLSAHFSQVFEQAAGHLRNDQVAQALTALQDLLVLYQGLRHTVHGWQQDPQLLADEQLIRHYLRWIQAHGDSLPVTINWLADAMQWTGWQKHPGHGP